MSWANVMIRTVGLVSLAGGLAVAQAATTARPGTLNYTEGAVSLDGRGLTSKSIGSTEVEPGQILRTAQGKAEMLLTPGVFLRLGDHAAVKMISPSLTDTRVELLRGEAMLEADNILDGNHLVIAIGGVDTHIAKHGLYRFTANPAQLSVYDGKAEVYVDERVVDVGKGKQLSLVTQSAAATLKPQKFDRKQTDALYQWSDVRSQYMAQANEATVQNIVVDGPGWYGMGWYWNPWYSSWAFVPGAGYYGSPFGYSFYSPLYWRSYAPFRYYGGPRYVQRTPVFRGPVMRGGFHGGAMRGGRGGRR